MKKSIRIAKRILALLLVLALFLQRSSLTITYAVEGDDKEYISELQIFVGKTVNDAIAQAKAAGFECFPYDLNSGNDSDVCILGYRTTDNPNQAITDISVLEMNNGYVMYDYAKILESQMESMSVITLPLMNSIAEYRENLLAGSPGAREAQAILNVFFVPDVGDMPLGDYLASEDVTETYLKKIMALSNSAISYAIFTAMTPAVADFGQENWAQRIYDSKVQEQLGSGQYNTQLDRTYKANAKDLTKVLQEFYENFTKAKLFVDTYGFNALVKDVEETPENEVPEGTLEKLQNNEEFEDTSNYPMYLAAYDILNQYLYNDTTPLADYILSLGTLTYGSDEDYRKIYPLLEALTQGQFGVLRIVGVPEFAMTLVNEDELLERVGPYVDSIRENILAYTNGESDTLSVFAGVDMALYKGQVAMTSDANRQTRASGEYAQLTQLNTFDENLDKVYSAALVASSIIGIGTFVVAASIHIYTIATTGFAAWWAGLALFSAWTTCFNAAVGLGSTLLVSMLGFLGCVVLAMGVIIFAVIVVILFIMLFRWLQRLWGPEDDKLSYNLNSIPKEVFDYKDGNYIKYNGVKQCGYDSTADLNMLNGKRFAALFTTTNTNAGEPLTVKDAEDTFHLQKNMPTPDPGYESVHYFGSKEAADLNAYCKTESAPCLYLSYFRTEENEINEGTEDETIEKEYLAMLKVSHEKTEAAAKDALKKEGFTVIDFNLTGNMKGKEYGYSYLGYKTTKLADNAITDIRVCPGYSGLDYGFGGANYVNAGTTAAGTGILFSKSSVVGTPIYANPEILPNRSDAKEGYEPVNLFSGGPAYNLNEGSHPEDSPSTVLYDSWGKNASYIYFLPTVTYTEGTEYLGGLNFFMGQNTSSAKGDQIRKFAESEGYTVLDGDFSKKYLTEERDIDSYGNYITYYGRDYETVLGYTTTYNPYRAIYDLRAYAAIPGLTSLSPSTGNYMSTKGAYGAAETFFQRNPEPSYDFNKLSSYSRGCSISHSYLGTQHISRDADQSYEEVDGVDKEDFEDFNPQNTNFRMKGLYLGGPMEGKAPLVPADIQTRTSTKDHEALLEQGFNCIQDVRTPNRTEPHNLAYSQKYPVYLYVKKPVHEGKYISSIYVASWDLSKYKKDNAIKDLDDDQEDMLNDTAIHYCTSVLMSTCTDEIILRNLALPYGDSWEGGVKHMSDIGKVAYLGVSRTDDVNKAIRSIIKFKPDKGETASQMITVYGTVYTRAGDTPIKDSHGSYYLYYSLNDGCAPSEPITKISFDDIPIVKDAATALTATVTDITEIKVNGEVKRAGRVAELKGYTNETYYIHSFYETKKTYVCDVYVGSGSSKKAAMVDLLNMGCNMMIPIDMNENASGQYVYLGYDRYYSDGDNGAYALKDIVFTIGEDAKEKITVNGATYIRARDRYIMSGDKKHAVSFNEGTNGRKIYLYYTSDKTEKASEPIMQLAATRCDFVPDNQGRYVWEGILTTEGKRCNLNDGVYCSKDGYSYDNRIYVYANREANQVKEGAAIVGGTTESKMQYGKLVFE